MSDLEVRTERKRRPASRPLVSQLLVFRPRLFAAAGIAVAVLLFGTPHLLVTYECIGRCTSSRARSCDYLGVHGWRNGVKPVRDRCTIIRLL